MMHYAPSRQKFLPALAGALIISSLSACAQHESKPAAAAPGAAEATKLTPLLSKEFANIPGKEGLMLTVEYAPGASSPQHRHNAHVFVYVLEGSIVMQAKGGQEVTLGPGQTFYESPGDIHAVSKNASSTIPAKFLVYMVKDKGAAPVLPAQ
jgi:quercetin dioxygenase-like cupin family protein